MSTVARRMLADRQAWCCRSRWWLPSYPWAGSREGHTESNLGFWSLIAHLQATAISTISYFLPKQFQQIGIKHSYVWVYGPHLKPHLFKSFGRTICSKALYSLVWCICWSLVYDFHSMPQGSNLWQFSTWSWYSRYAEIENPTTYIVSLGQNRITSFFFLYGFPIFCCLRLFCATIAKYLRQGNL